MSEDLTQGTDRPHGGEYVYCTESGARLHNGNLLHYTVGEPWAATDPFVANNRGLFQSEPIKVRSTVPTEKIERATRAPGERRGTGRR